MRPCLIFVINLKLVISIGFVEWLGNLPKLEILKFDSVFDPPDYSIILDTPKQDSKYMPYCNLDV